MLGAQQTSFEIVGYMARPIGKYNPGHHSNNNTSFLVVLMVKTACGAIVVFASETFLAACC